jgi:hypothetical protein
VLPPGVYRVRGGWVTASQTGHAAALTDEHPFLY